jgi:hypothetical protein
VRLSILDIDILRALSRGQVPSASPTHRIRLELLGLARDTSTGLVLTPLGQHWAHLQPTIEHETFAPLERRVDVRGRKLAADRTLDRIT